MRTCIDAIERGHAADANEAAVGLAAGGQADVIVAARLLYLLRDYHAALQILDQDHPGHARLRYSMLKRLRYEVEAGQQLSKLLADTPDADTHRAAAHHFVTTSRPADALHHAKQGSGITTARVYLQRAKLAAAAGERAEAEAAAVHAWADEDVRDAATSVLLEVGCYDRLGALARASTPVAHTAIAELCLYAGDHISAQAHATTALKHNADDLRALEVAIGAAVLGEDRQQAHQLLARAEEPTTTMSVWAGELALAEGEHAAAVRELERARDAVPNHVAANLLLVLTRPVGAREPVGSQEGLLEGQLAALGAPPQIIDNAVTGEEMHRAARRALTRMAGNRTPFSSVVDDGALRRVWLPSSSRHQIRHRQHTAAHLGIDEALTSVDEILDRTHSISLCYRGELELWAGRYAAAARTFEESLRIRRRTVWAWIGLGASRTLAGDPAQGLATIDEGVDVIGWRGATVPIYRAEALHALERHAAALTEIEHAAAAHPHRLASHLLRVSCLDAAGEDTTDAFDTLCRTAPALVSDAARSIAVAPWWPGRLDKQMHAPVARAALTLCRGNRSSSCAIWFAPDTHVVRSFVAGRPATVPAWERDELDALGRLARE